MLNEWLIGKEDKIELQYLPSYCPHLNPVEFINSTIKNEIYRLPPCSSQQALNDRVTNALRNLQRNKVVIAKTINHVFKDFSNIREILSDHSKSLKL
jgi:transposase